MPRIFDNISQKLVSALCDSLEVSFKSDFCVGYFNLRGWRHISDCIDKFTGDGENKCRLLIGMCSLPSDELREIYKLKEDEFELDNQTAILLKKKIAAEFKEQLTYGFPTNEDESGLRKLSQQIKLNKLNVKLFLKHPLHAKLYLAYRNDKINPVIAYLGSSNLTVSGLLSQGELNVDVLDEDAALKLEKWFKDRWEDRWCIDISKELVEIIDTSWAGDQLIPPYHIYLKMAYHLAQEARAGLSEFKIPKDFKNKLLDFQVKAVQIAAHHLNKRDGVMIGDVVGLGKTLMATALARIFEDDYSLETLIICPKNLVTMWEDYCHTYRLRAKVISSSVATSKLESLRRYRLVIIDESHNLRNREGKRYQAIREYLDLNASKVILLTATPFNKTYIDLSNQLRLFIAEDQDLGIRPEKLISEMTEPVFLAEYQCPVRSIQAFEKSENPDDWRDLMKLYLVRRTRTFIKENYAKTDESNGRKYLTFSDGTRSYFPDRIPKKKRFIINEKDENDQYAKLYHQNVVNTINSLNLPRYGLGNYLKPQFEKPPTQIEEKIIKDLSRAGKRLMGFCRTNLFKRLESNGFTFLLSVSRHIVRNYVYIYALENNLPLPIGKQGAELVETDFYSGDKDIENYDSDMFGNENEENTISDKYLYIPDTLNEYKLKSEIIYNTYVDLYKSKFKWISPELFVKQLLNQLISDSKSLLKIIQDCGEWKIENDMKLKALEDLCSKKHKEDKVLIFTQYADTANYIGKEFKKRRIKNIEFVTGDSEDPTLMAYKFSPNSNKELLKDKNLSIKPENEIRVLVSTDVLSEGQNLQDCHIIVNFDLPWAIIRLIQRAGRVDRIGQQAEEILCYSFMPADGVERIINLRGRVLTRLRQNAEVVGTDELFFEDEKDEVRMLEDLYNEKAGILDDEDDSEVDLTSLAYQIWINALEKDPKLLKIIPELPSVVYTTKENNFVGKPDGVLLYTRTGEGNDVLSWIDDKGKTITQSQIAVLKAAECKPDTEAIPKNEKHHELVEIGLKNILSEEKSVGGQLGKPSGAKYKTYIRLKNYLDTLKDTLFDSIELSKALDEIYRFPLYESAKDTLNRQLKAGIGDQNLAELILALRQDGRLCIISDTEEYKEPKIICSMGIFTK